MIKRIVAAVFVAAVAVFGVTAPAASASDDNGARYSSLRIDWE